MRAYLLLLLIAAGTTYLATPLVRRMAERAGALSPVRDRDVHSVPTPRLGGLAMLAGVAVAFAAASQMPFLSDLFSDSRQPWAVLGAAAIVSLLGVADDVWGLDPLTKLAGQVLAAGLMAWQGVQLLGLPWGGGLVVGSGGLLLTVTVLAVVVAVNAVNFVDGLDGLAAGVVGIGGAAFFVYSYLLTRSVSTDNYANLASMTVAVLVGVCLGFLPHNVHPARIFMGDSGSMLIGLLLAASAVSVNGRFDPAALGQVTGAQVAPLLLPVLLPIAVLLLPLTDLVLAVVRRMLAGQSPFAADKLHLHHRLLSLGHTHGRAVLVLWLWTAVVSFGAISPAFVPLHVALPGWGVALAVAVVVTLGPARRRSRTHGPVLLKRRGGPGAGASDRVRRASRPQTPTDQEGSPERASAPTGGPTPRG
ncbi:UDP-GlcNAc:undecaprenyl-phosphate GlcNAc-1-phosphate transferase [Quadrisphaera granulorum]|uniref:UDP-GlcNAc:undecaprenyl-phosphate GlcNAc-1-phosphate transferase n=1 Tax=Quadrisphaera granulorum TaxID=317664 RepID=A0A316AES4_9ACTN|nr:MraY family glycosyltransferase [Quadrisphaera granulorum]PWJ56286.1 UDP-GlcNAc:undecaprenyl-phosphate GlcNAc-1-phosphate transferase [Quadrisphaera granulorum]SZE94920.1 UDP-GlcNAc:undecaprenyl-phosphate GlcNAc-1-phosphate transferase [Quadrisphaera granulorum]